MQYMTDSFLPSTPHKVGLNTRDRFAFAYFHEPSFQAVVKPLPGYVGAQQPKDGIHYGVSLPDMLILSLAIHREAKVFLRRTPRHLTDRTPDALYKHVHEKLPRPNYHPTPRRRGPVQAVITA